VIELLASAWGNWPRFVGVGIALLVQGYRLASVSPALAPLAWDRIPERLRPLIAIAFAGVASFGIALVGGAGWAAAADSALLAWGTALIGADTLRLAAGKPPVQP